MINKVMPIFGRRNAEVIPETRFVLEVKSDNTGTSATNQFTIPTNANGITIAFNYDVETSDGYTATGLTGDHTITFPSGAGTHLIYISGSFPYMFFNNGGDRLKLLNISNFGVYGLGSTLQISSFRGCSNMNITANDAGNFESVTNFQSTWQNCSSIISFPLIDTGNGFIFSNTWNGCSSLALFPLIDTSNATNLAATWANCSSLLSFPLLNTSSNTTFTFTWFGNLNLANFPSNAFDTSITTNYSFAFTSTSLTSQSIDDILISMDTSGVSNGTFDQSGGSAPSTTGESAITSLRGKGWTVTVTGGF